MLYCIKASETIKEKGGYHNYDILLLTSDEPFKNLFSK